jgi:hypothetical protein
MGPLGVVVLHVRLQGPVEVSSATDERPVQAFRTDCPNPPLRERVRPGRSERCAHDLDALGPEHLVERSGVLGIAVVEEDHGVVGDTVDDEIAGLLGHPR